MSVCDNNVCVPYVIVVMVTRVNYPPSIDVDHLYTIQEGQVLDITFKTSDVESHRGNPVLLQYANVTHGSAMLSLVSDDVINNVLVMLLRVEGGAIFRETTAIVEGTH